MRSRSKVALVGSQVWLLWLLCLVPGRLHADSLVVPPLDWNPPVAASVGSGAGLAFGSLIAGGLVLGLAAQDERDYVQKRVGFHVIVDGLFLAPIVSHLIAHEWKRAVVFGAINLALGSVALGLLEGTDSLLDSGEAGPRITFGAAVALELIVAAVGVGDSLFAGERASERRKKQVRIPVLPGIGMPRTGQGLLFTLGGSL